MLVIGSRGSRLALWQSQWVKARLEALDPRIKVRIDVIKTTGDHLATASLSQIGGKGVFTKELEDALLDDRIDLAVHSLKDLPTQLPQGLEVAAVTEREDVHDALVITPRLATTIRNLNDLPPHARIGTSSLRRAAQLRHCRSDVEVVDVRGNIETRLHKLDSGEYDAIILAAAGLLRLGFEARIDERIDRSRMLPAVGQGALGVETRSDDFDTRRIVEGLNHRPTKLATDAERAVLRSLGGGCAVPIAAHAWIEHLEGEERLVIEALVAELNGRRIIRDRIDGQPHAAEALGQVLAERLLSAGAGELLDGFDTGN